MSFAKTASAQTSLLKAHIVSVEVDLSKGLNAFSVVGLPDKAVEESRDRVSAAIKNTGFTSPKQKNQKTVVSLAPADLKKEGPIFDLAIALAYLLAAGETSFDAAGLLFLGELSLDGELRPVTGVLPLVAEAKRRGFREVYLPKENVREAALVGGIAVFGVKTLSSLLAHLSSDAESGAAPLAAAPRTKIPKTRFDPEIDFSDVRGQESAKRGLMIAAAGGHNLAMWGPPGTGKTMLAKAFAGILPPLSFDEVLEVTGIHSVAGALDGNLITAAPFRSPHHTASYVSLVGGGAIPRPGEITLAHRGVLFLDEFPEFDRRVIETLRQPLEERFVAVSRAKGSARFPAHFILIAAMNPCPCGWSNVAGKSCTCLPIQIERYRRKISGPIVDRIDLWVEVSRIDYEKLGARRKEKSESAEARKLVIAARGRQAKRFAKKGSALTNASIGARDLERLIPLSDNVQAALRAAAETLSLSARSYHRVWKLARTIADLEGAREVGPDHLHDALQYRPKNLTSI